MKTREEIVKRVIEWFKRADPDEQVEFLDAAPEDLIMYHHTLGRNIRNEFKLWEAEWIPDIQEGVDCSSGHPDALSQSIIEEVYFKMKEEIVK